MHWATAFEMGMNVQILNIRLIHTIIIIYIEISSIAMRKYACRCPLVYYNNNITESCVLIYCVNLRKTISTYLQM